MNYSREYIEAISTELVEHAHRDETPTLVLSPVDSLLVITTLSAAVRAQRNLSRREAEVTAAYRERQREILEHMIVLFANGDSRIRQLLQRDLDEPRTGS